MQQRSRAAREILEDAAFLLRPGSGTTPPGYSIESSFPAPVRVMLPDVDAASSKARGSDGCAAALDGGWIRIMQAASRPSQPGDRGDHVTLFLRLRDPAGAWNAPIAADYGSDGTLRFSLSALDRAGRMSLLFELYTDHTDTPFTMETVLDMIRPELWHDVAVRFTGHHAALFVDGLLVDEEWPIGALRGAGRGTLLLGRRDDWFQPSAGFLGLIDHAAVWHRGLTEEEILELSGGAAGAASRGWLLPRGSDTGTMQYSRGPGGGFVGDCLPFFHNGVYHLYYLLDRRHHRSKAGLGAHQWAHSSSADLVRWTHHPLAIPITEQREGSICTGYVFYEGGTWYGFYATRMPDRSEHLSLAVSTDGIRFEKTLPNPFASPRPPYKQGPFRDPTVFRDPRSGQFHMLVTAELEHPPVPGRGGCLAHLVSSDLRTWEQQEPFLVTGYADQPECSELFSWGEWYYLVFSHFGYAHYRMSRSPFGPWSAPAVDVIDGPLARVMKSAPFAGERRIGTFFVAEGDYAGFAVFRDLVRNPDGTLGSRWPAEMVPAAGHAVSPGCAPLTPGVTCGARSIRIESRQGFAAAGLSPIPADVLIRFRANPAAGTRAFGIGLRAGPGGTAAQELHFEPGRRKAGWRRSRTASWRECETAALYEVDCLDKPFTAEILSLGNILDVCIDGKRTLINNEEAAAGELLFFFCHEGAVGFEDIEIRPVLKSP